MATSDLRSIPGVGPNIARDLEEIGVHAVADLAGRDPEELYRLDCARKGFQEDRCQLYVFRLAVYFAEHPAAGAGEAQVVVLEEPDVSGGGERMSDVETRDDYVPTALESMHRYWKRDLYVYLFGF